MRFFYICLVFIFLLIACNKNTPGNNNIEIDKSLFKKLDSTQTGIRFKNILKPTEQLNIIDYTYFYNGGGVAAADFNNDGLEDLFFVSNQNKNQLYLNKGNLSFEDISESAEIGGNAQWNTGVTIADVNNDGFVDIYVCGVSNYAGLKSKNELFINNGDLTFTESAAKYGLDLETYATQASFFDYDHDGDLDCYLLNYALQESENYVPIHKGRRQDKQSGDYLLRNDNGFFNNVTIESGILQSKIGFGLAVTVTDINNDGWEDIYVSNDFHEDDYLYINQKNGKFKEQGREYFNHFSRFSMGCDIADINNDGFMDIINLDMYPYEREIEKMSVGEDPFDIYNYKLSYGYYPQYAKNSLQLNNEGESFSEIASYSGIAATDWSWASLFADFDNDGIKDLLVSNGIPKRANDLDFINFVLNYQKRDPSKINLQEYYDEAIGQMPNGSYHDFVYKGTDSLKFIDKSVDWGFNEATISNGTVYSDLDNDGDLDIIINRLNDQVGVYENKTDSLLQNNFLKVELRSKDENSYGVGSKVIVFTGDTHQTQQLVNTRGFQSAVGNTLYFGLGDYIAVDSVKVIWNRGAVQVEKAVVSNQKLVINKTTSGIKATTKTVTNETYKEITCPIPFSHQENAFNDFAREPLMPFKISTEGPALAVGDINNDGLDDVFVGGARSQSGEIWIQLDGGKFKKLEQEDFVNDAILEQVDAAFFDADSDGDLDLYVVIAGNEFFGKMQNQQDCLYMNDGKGNFTKTINSLPEMPTNTSCVKPADFDDDGDIDLFVGGRVVSKSYGLIPNSYVLENNGTGVFNTITDNNLKTIGMVTDADWIDVDSDNDLDLIVVGEWMSPLIFKNNGGNFTKEKATNVLKSGLWHSMASGDFDNDGDIDFIAGNLGTNTKFYRNGKEDLSMFVKDFDNNGAVEQIVCYKENEQWFPVEGRDELGKPLPSIIKRRFSTHKSFANKSIKDIFTEEELKDCNILKVNTLQSFFFENVNGIFKAHGLPKEVNYSTMFAVLPVYSTENNKTDILMAGNYLSVNTWQTPYDASYGVTLSVSTSNDLQNINNSGFYTRGEVRHLKEITINDKRCVLVGKNNEPIQCFEIRE